VGFRVAVRSEAKAAQRAAGQQRAPRGGGEATAAVREAAPPPAGPPQAGPGPASPLQAASRRGPQLSGRDTILLWDGDGETPRFSPWVIADVRRREFTFPSVRADRQRVALLKADGYQVVFRRDGYVVLHAPRAAR
jgi:hypothetical protein